MLTKKTFKIHSRSIDNNNSNYIDVKNLTSSRLDNTNKNISEKHINAFEKLLNGEKFDFDLLNLQVKNSENICTAKIETTGPTGNIISYLVQKHKIYEHSKPLTVTPSLKQTKIDYYTVLSNSFPQMTYD
ncbi:hypothetical protein C1645_836157 [Glomus cerebriforme]|uniref:Uncharacterized protein n=1 Tax=Glomus cerebriforme TaxID=658196 RepID=A0A397SGN7_9GLOM|nr:hypothetical protein C1645_836157 [Glomus cerebriforme]